ncbi:MAG: hypothetical protein IJX77_02350 [Ruminococcus sp.]|nr:hypothetical protein [Ruminococcus sp.]
MSSETLISAREAYPVRIGALVMYCEQFKGVSTRNFAEKASVSGDTFFSNTNKKALRITLEGRIYDEYLPLRVLLFTNNFMNGDSVCNIEYRGLTFTNCHVLSVTAEDSGEEFIRASITLITTESITQSEVEADAG